MSYKTMRSQTGMMERAAMDYRKKGGGNIMSWKKLIALGLTTGLVCYIVLEGAIEQCKDSKILEVKTNEKHNKPS